MERGGVKGKMDFFHPFNCNCKFLTLQRSYRYGDHKRERFDSYSRGTPHGYHNRDARDREHRDSRDRERDRRGVDKRR